MIRAILFDAVGTLIYPEPDAVEVYSHYGRKFGSNLSREVIGVRFSEAMREFFPTDPIPIIPTGTGESPASGNAPTCSERIEYSRWQNIVASVFVDVANAHGELFRQLWKHFARSDSWVVYSDARETWQRLASRELTIGIASNFDHRIQAVCSGLEPLDECTHLFWSASIGYAKPHPGFFRRIESNLGLSSQDILLIGNDPS